MRGTTVEHKISQGLGPVDESGHTPWLGRRSRSMTPMIRHKKHDLSATRIVFEGFYGRPPVGECYANCSVRYCMTPEHIMDETIRLEWRMSLRELYGMPVAFTRSDECVNGHDLGEHGRIGSNLEPYCQACCTIRARTRRGTTNTIRKDITC